MSDLSKKKCVACDGNTPPFDTKESQNFVSKISDIAEDENHHPDITFGWGYCKIKIFTHAIEGLAESDFILAAKIDQI
jgi:4a-hydroxytetrahydrobiopterin dehydratase